MAAKKKEEKETKPEKKETSTTTSGDKVEEIEDTSTDKRFEELEKKISEQGDIINQQSEYIKGSSVVINTLAYTPELKEAWEKYGRPRVVGEGQTPGQQPQQGQTQTNTSSDATGPNEDITRQVSDVVASQRENTIKQFEKDFGIESQKEEDRKETRRKLESYLNDFGWSVRNVPLQKLRDNLERAYYGTHIDKLKEEGKLEGIAQVRANEKGAIGAMSGEEGGTGEQKQQLTKGQAEWAEKLGVDVEGAKEKYLSKDEEYKRVVKAEKKEEE